MDETTERQQTARSASGPAATAATGSYKGLAIALGVLVIALCVGLWMRHNNAIRQAKDLQDKITLLSSQVVQANTDLNEAKQVNSTLETHLQEESDAAKRLSKKRPNRQPKKSPSAINGFPNWKASAMI
jgi:hypothetical protein